MSDERDVLDIVQSVRVKTYEPPSIQARDRNKAGPVVAEPDSLQGHGCYVAYGHNAKGHRFAAIYRHGRRITSWGRL